MRWRPLLLPVEHGGWGLLLEPVVIALVAVPSAAGGLLSLAALGLFLARQPLKVAVDDLQRGRSVPRTKAAWMVAAAYLASAALALDRKRVEILACEAPLTRDVVRGDALRRQVIRRPHVIRKRESRHLEVRAHRHARHVLDAAADRDVHDI